MWSVFADVVTCGKMTETTNDHEQHHKNVENVSSYTHVEIKSV